jgi:hypothetical protein
MNKASSPTQLQDQPTHSQDQARTAGKPRLRLPQDMGTLSQALQVVQDLRVASRALPHLHLAVQAVKRSQCQRFCRSYADVLVHPDWGGAAHFFLRELYGEQDFSQRDAQFGRIASGMERLFPSAVLKVATTLTQLHALSEQLDYAMGQALLVQYGTAPTDAQVRTGYVSAWRSLGEPAARQEQVALAQTLCTGLAQLTRMPGLRLMLTMMRGPAQAAGLHDLQGFLERSFDTFSGLQRSKAGTKGFMQLVAQREQAWMARLFDVDLTNTYSVQLWPELE